MRERERERERDCLVYVAMLEIWWLIITINHMRDFPCVCVFVSQNIYIYIYIYIKEIGLLNVQAFIESRLSILFTHKFALILIPKRTSKIVIITPRLQTQNLTSKYPM